VFKPWFFKLNTDLVLLFINAKKKMIMGLVPVLIYLLNSQTKNKIIGLMIFVAQPFFYTLINLQI
jgi:hypothetical protein